MRTMIVNSKSAVRECEEASTSAHRPPRVWGGERECPQAPESVRKGARVPTGPRECEERCPRAHRPPRV